MGTLKVKYSDFNQITRSKTIPAAFRTILELQAAIDGLLAPVFPTAKGIRLLGVSLSSLEGATASNQLMLGL